MTLAEVLLQQLQRQVQLKGSCLQMWIPERIQMQGGEEQEGVGEEGVLD